MGHAAVVAARVVAAPLVRVRMGTCGGRKGTANLRCPIKFMWNGEGCKFILVPSTFVSTPVFCMLLRLEYNRTFHTESIQSLGHLKIFEDTTLKTEKILSSPT